VKQGRDCLETFQIFIRSDFLTSGDARPLIPGK
jgi:hypothetical protein